MEGEKGRYAVAVDVVVVVIVFVENRRSKTTKRAHELATTSARIFVNTSKFFTAVIVVVPMLLAYTWKGRKSKENKIKGGGREEKSYAINSDHLISIERITASRNGCASEKLQRRFEFYTGEPLNFYDLIAAYLCANTSKLSRTSVRSKMFYRSYSVLRPLFYEGI